MDYGHWNGCEFYRELALWPFTFRRCNSGCLAWIYSASKHPKRFMRRPVLERFRTRFVLLPQTGLEHLPMYLQLETAKLTGWCHWSNRIERIKRGQRPRILLPLPAIQVSQTCIKWRQSVIFTVPRCRVVLILKAESWLDLVLQRLVVKSRSSMFFFFCARFASLLRLLLYEPIPVIFLELFWLASNKTSGVSGGPFLGKFFNSMWPKPQFFEVWHQFLHKRKRPKLSTCIQIDKLASQDAKNLR